METTAGLDALGPWFWGFAVLMASISLMHPLLSLFVSAGFCLTWFIFGPYPHAFGVFVMISLIAEWMFAASRVHHVRYIAKGDFWLLCLPEPLACSILLMSRDATFYKAVEKNPRALANVLRFFGALRQSRLPGLCWQEPDWAALRHCAKGHVPDIHTSVNVLEGLICVGRSSLFSYGHWHDLVRLFNPNPAKGVHTEISDGEWERMCNHLLALHAFPDLWEQLKEYVIAEGHYSRLHSMYSVGEVVPEAELRSVLTFYRDPYMLDADDRMREFLATVAHLNAWDVAAAMIKKRGGLQHATTIVHAALEHGVIITFSGAPREEDAVDAVENVNVGS